MEIKSNFLKIFTLLLSCLLYHSCKKDDTRQNLPIDKIAGAKEWYSAQAKQSTVYVKTGKTDSVLISREPLWDSLKTLTAADQSLVLVVPVKTNLFEVTKKEGFLNLVISYSETQKEFRLLNKFKNGKADTVKLNAAQLYQMAFPKRENIIESKLNFRNVDAKGSSLQLPKTNTSGRVTMSTCMHHYWVEKYWVDGVVVHEEWTYLYSTGCGSEGGGHPTEQYPTPDDGAPVPSPAPRDITVNTTDTCITKTVVAALMNNKNVMGIMADIIKKFDADKTININIFDGQIYYKNTNGSFLLDSYGNKIPKPGEASNIRIENGIFKADITLGIDYHKNTSKESLIASLIHEVVHAHLGYTASNLLDYENNHEIIAEKYLVPMAKYLNGSFGIPMDDALSLAWSGVSDSMAYRGSTDPDKVFVMRDGQATYSITKGDMDRLSGAYKLSTVDPSNNNFKKGIKICD